MDVSRSGQKHAPSGNNLSHELVWAFIHSPPTPPRAFPAPAWRVPCHARPFAGVARAAGRKVHGQGSRRGGGLDRG
eukprot:scaffold1248_cov393-Prasinococcus_capsulatus_cf.AAC.20